MKDGEMKIVGFAALSCRDSMTKAQPSPNYFFFFCTNYAQLGESSININEMESNEYILKIYNCLGDDVLERKISNQTHINTSDFSKGMHEVLVSDESGKIYHAEKVVIQ